MNSSNTFTFDVRVKICALAVMFLLFAGGSAVRAQHQGHDMQNMPGMNKRKPKAKSKAKRKARSKARPIAQRKKSARAVPKKHDMHGMDMSMPMPAQSPKSGSSTTPGKTEMEHMPGMHSPAATSTPSAAPQAHDMHMPGMQMPAHPSSTTPQASPSPD